MCAPASVKDNDNVIMCVCHREICGEIGFENVLSGVVHAAMLIIIRVCRQHTEYVWLGGITMLANIIIIITVISLR